MQIDIKVETSGHRRDPPTRRRSDEGRGQVLGPARPRDRAQGAQPKGLRTAMSRGDALPEGESRYEKRDASPGDGLHSLNLMVPDERARPGGSSGTATNCAAGARPTADAGRGDSAPRRIGGTDSLALEARSALPRTEGRPRLGFGACTGGGGSACNAATGDV